MLHLTKVQDLFIKGKRKEVITFDATCQVPTQCNPPSPSPRSWSDTSFRSIERCLLHPNDSWVLLFPSLSLSNSQMPQKRKANGSLTRVINGRLLLFLGKRKLLTDNQSIIDILKQWRGSAAPHGSFLCLSVEKLKGLRDGYTPPAESFDQPI